MDSPQHQPPDDIAPVGAAEAEARRTVDARPGDAGAWHSLAFALIEAGKLDLADQALARSVALDPFSVMARNNLGIVRQRLGDAGGAEEAYQAALTLDPDNAVANANLAGLLCEQGRYADALEHAQRAARIDPGQLAPYIYAAVAQANLDRQDLALGWIDRALSLAPGNGHVLLERADLLRVLGRADEGLAAAVEAATLEPDNAKAHNLIGLSHQAMGRDEAALAAFDRAAVLAPQSGQVLTNRAVVLAELGEPALALAALDQALAAEPGLATAWLVRAELKRFVAGDPDLAVMERLAAQDPLPRRDQILLRFALGKAYLDIGDGPRAFLHLGEGGRLQRTLLHHDPAEAEREMAAIAQAFSPALFEQLGAAGDPSSAPIFIIGMPRCGGTLVEQIIASHPKVQAGGEARHIEGLVRNLGGAYPAQVGALTPGAIAAMGRDYLVKAAMARGASRITDKAANSYLYAGLIHLILPGARIIHCRRDPIDSCLSCYSKLFATGQGFSYDLAELGAYYCDYAALMAHWRAVLPTDRFIEVDYEAVVEDLEGQTRRLLGFCGLDWDQACLRFFDTRRPVRTASLSQVRQPLYRSSVGRWRDYRNELAPLIEALGELGGE